MIYAVIDLGSNTIRLSVYKCEANNVKVLFTKKEMTGLAGYSTDGCLDRAGTEKACYTLNKFKQTLENFEIDAIYVFATASLRNIKNTAAVIQAIKNETNFDVEVISGEEEAVLDFVGATKSVKTENGLLIDIGGGSTELVIYENSKILRAASMPIGSLNMFAKYVDKLIPDKNEKNKIENAVTEELLKLNINPDIQKIICGVGGSIRAIAKVCNDYFDLPEPNNKICISNLKKIQKAVLKDEKSGLDIILRVVPDRLRTICTGMIILKTVAKYFFSEEIIVSSKGVREGYLYSKILGETL